MSEQKKRIPDHEVEEFKNKTMRQALLLVIIEAFITLICYLCIDGFFSFIIVVPGVCLFIGVITYLVCLARSQEDWRNELGKTWKYRSDLGKAQAIGSILWKLFG